MYNYSTILSLTLHRMGKDGTTVNMHIFNLNVLVFTCFLLLVCLRFLSYVDTTIPPNIIGHHSDLQPVPEPVTEFTGQYSEAQPDPESRNIQISEHQAVQVL